MTSSLAFCGLFLLVVLLSFDSAQGFTSSPSIRRSHLTVCQGAMRHVNDGLREIVDDYDVFLLDMWGVMHDGSKAYDGVVQAINELKTRNKRLIILSNSSKRKANSVRALTTLGFDGTCFEEIITSGEVSHDLLSSSGAATTNKQWWSNVFQEGQPKKAILLGSGEDDIEFCQECGWQCTDSVDEATLIIARGTFTIHTKQHVMIDKRIDGTDMYDETLATILEAAAKKRLPMLVANPDKIRPDASLSPMPGAIGEAYRKMIGDDDLVVSIGKPFTEVYERALSNCDLSRVCMVGDALETDVLGGNAVGIDTVWVVKDGVYAGSSLDPEDILTEFNNSKETTYARGKTVLPTLCMPHFRW